MNSQALLENLQNDVRKLIEEANRLQQQPEDLLAKPPAPGSWSIAQVLEHLNIYSRYYNHAIEDKLHLHHTAATTQFNPGWLGDYFTRLMRPGAGNTISKKMKAPKNALPSAQPDGKAMLHEFLHHQHHLLTLLQVAQTANINTLRVAISLSRFITLKLGDTFRFLVAHEQRHFIQIGRVLTSLG